MLYFSRISVAIGASLGNFFLDTLGINYTVCRTVLNFLHRKKIIEVIASTIDVSKLDSFLVSLTLDEQKPIEQTVANTFTITSKTRSDIFTYRPPLFAKKFKSYAKKELLLRLVTL